jgi:uncharacterized protein
MGDVVRIPVSAVPTFTGRSLVLTAPTSDAIDIQDIAQSLSLTCRWVGQIGTFYSVAQHSVLCSYMCEPGDALAGLLHDAAEAYMGDVTRPVKALAGMDAGYLPCEAHLTAIILQHFGLSGHIPASVTRADDELCLIEAHELFPTPPEWARQASRPLTRLRIQPWTHWSARIEFLRRFEALTGVRR